MDATLAFVTASFARVRPGDLVLDPFCGTGGNLLAACHMSQRAVPRSSVRASASAPMPGRRDM